jgi:ribose transport system permease protein
VPVQFFYCVLIMLMIWYAATCTPLGVRALFVGQSREVAVLSGIKADRIRWGAFILAGVIAALAGVLYVGTTGSAGPTSVGTFLLPAYAAIFLGATSIQPGRFNALGTGVAVLFLAAGVAGLQLLGAQDYAQQLFYGAALVLAVTISRYLRRNWCRGPVPELMTAQTPRSWRPCDRCCARRRGSRRWRPCSRSGR